MKHPSSQILFAHWNDRRGGYPLPERGAIDPGAIRGALGDTFILSFDTLAQYPFRLAGTRLCALFGQELKGQPFLALWQPEGWRQMASLIDVVADETIGIVAGATGRNADGASVELEILLLPLQHAGRSHARLIGAVSPLSAPYWLGMHPLLPLTLGEHRYVGPRVTGPAPVLPFPPPEARRRHGLIVYDGGQA